MANTPHDGDRILTFWFGPLDEDRLANGEHFARWWKKDAAFDELVRSEFGEDHRAVAAGEREGWRTTPRGRLAYVIALDQFSRNMFRGDARTFAQDARAREVAIAALAEGDDRSFGASESMFLYMPLMHSEVLADQERCVALFREASERYQGPAGKLFAGTIDYAIRHRDIVARFGRFPHRNEVLGRLSTPEEAEFLKQPGSSF